MKKQYTCPIAEVFEIQANGMIAGSLTGKNNGQKVLPPGPTITSGEADSKTSAFTDFDTDCADDFSIE